MFDDDDDGGAVEIVVEVVSCLLDRGIQLVDFAGF